MGTARAVTRMVSNPIGQAVTVLQKRVPPVALRKSRPGPSGDNSVVTLESC